MRKLLFYFCFLFFIKSYGQNSLYSTNTSPQVATVGILLTNVSELDMSDNSFHADFYLWCRWKGSINPLKNIEFSNLEDEWSFSDTDLHDSAILLKDGFKYNSFHVRGRFTYNFKLHNYPFDKQKISVQFKNSTYTSDELLYIPDTTNSNIEPDVVIPGWTIGKLSFESKPHKYSSNFGLPENANSDN